MILAIAFAHLWGVLQLVVLGTTSRTVRIKTVLVTVAAGLYTCSLVALVFQFAWTRTFTAVSGLPLYEVVGAASYTLDPLIEEVVKVSPLLCLFLLIPAARRQWSVTDCVLIGAAAGSGFGLAEDLFRYGSLGNYHSIPATSGGWDLAVGLSFGTISSVWKCLTSWLPSAVHGDNLSPSFAQDFNLHLMWSAVGGLAVALIFLCRGNRNRRIGIALLLYVAFDHAALNHTLSAAQPGLLSVLAAPFNLARRVLFLMPLAAIVTAAWLDRARQHGALAPEFALESERMEKPRVLGLIKSALACLPWSLPLVDELVRLRRSHATEDNDQASMKLRGAIIVLRDRIDSMARENPHAVASTIKQGRVLVYSFLRQPTTIIWMVLCLPSFAWFVVGGLPETAWLQSVFMAPPLWLFVRLLSLAGFLWMVLRLLQGVRQFSSMSCEFPADTTAAFTIRLLSGTGALLFLAYVFILSWTSVQANSRVISNFHVLEALASSTVIGALLLGGSAITLFPPVGGGLADLSSTDSPYTGPVISGGNNAVVGFDPNPVLQTPRTESIYENPNPDYGSLPTESELEEQNNLWLDKAAGKLISPTGGEVDHTPEEPESE